VTRAKEKKLRWRECLEQYNKECGLREQEGLSPPPAPANSSSGEEEEEEESDVGGASERWNPSPLSPRAEGATVELVPMAGAEAPAAGSSVEAPAGAAKAPAGVTEVPPTLEEEEAGFLQLEVSSISPYTPLISRSCHLLFCFLLTG
jgi:hypothetical protein